MSEEEKIAPPSVSIDLECFDQRTRPYAFHADGRSFELILISSSYCLVERRVLGESTMIETWGSRKSPALLLGETLIKILNILKEANHE
jgi:hypothetical protein